MIRRYRTLVVDRRAPTTEHHHTDEFRQKFLHVPHAPPISVFPLPGPDSHWPSYGLYSVPFPECPVARIAQTVAFSDWLLSLGAFRFPVSAHGLTASSSLVFTSVPLEWATVCPSAHLLRDTLEASKF